MTSYFDDDVLSEDSDFESVSSSSSNNDGEYINPKIKNKPEKVNENFVDIDDDENEIQFGGVEDYPEDDDDAIIEEDEDNDDEEIENEELENNDDKNNKKKKSLPDNININYDDDMDDDSDSENYLKKFDKEINKNYIMNFHPECIMHNYDEVEALTKVVRDKNNIIVDDLHKTIPFLTKYERTRIIGQRAKQINARSPVFVKVPENVIDGYLIAELELKEKRIPFIIRRPLPNGGSEYWNVKDLENISF